MMDKTSKFIKKAKKLGYKIKSYSGRGMFGRECASIITDKPYDTIAKLGIEGLKVDNMGLQYVIYIG